MAVENAWAYDLEDTIRMVVSDKCLDALKARYPNTRITDEAESNQKAVFPTIYIHLLPASELGQTLDGKTINGVLATVQVTVTTNTTKADARYVMSVISEAFKNMRFAGTALPEYTDSDRLHKSVARFRRAIGANNRL